jgi:hypothetical protein
MDEQLTQQAINELAAEVPETAGESVTPAQEEAAISQADTAATPAETAEAPAVPKTVKAKMVVSALKEYAWGGKEVTLQCHYDQSIPEDQRFQKATPSGSISMQIDNPAALEQFGLGKAFYLNFEPIE